MSSSLPRTNPIPILSSPSSSHTQPELWLHSPLIHRQSYLSSGTIATERAQLRTVACRKIALLPQGCGTLCIQQHQPSNLSQLHIKSSSLRVEKRIPASVCLTVVQMEFLLLQCNRRQQQTTNLTQRYLLSPCHYADLPLVFLFVHFRAVWVRCEAYSVIHIGRRAPFQAAVPIYLPLMSIHLSPNEL